MEAGTLRCAAGAMLGRGNDMNYTVGSWSQMLPKPHLLYTARGEVVNARLLEN